MFSYFCDFDGLLFSCYYAVFLYIYAITIIFYNIYIELLKDYYESQNKLKNMSAAPAVQRQTPVPVLVLPT